MRRGDFIWILTFIAIAFLVFAFSKSDWPKILMNENMYKFSFISFSFCGLMRESLSERVRLRRYPGLKFMVCSALLWGVYGVCAVFMLMFYHGGVMMAQTVGLLPSFSNLGKNTFYELALFVFAFQLAGAFFSSVFYNLAFNFLCMALRHAIYKNYLARNRSRSSETVSDDPNWHKFIRYELFRNIPLFWIPLYTIVYFYPLEMWILMGAWLGLLLNTLLIITKQFGGYKTEATM